MSIGACYSHYHSLLVLAKWSIVKCRSTRWLLVNLCCFQCKDKGDLFWRCFKFPPYPCSMPSNRKRCMSLTAFYFLKNSGDTVLQHFDTFRTRLWPTKMPTGMVFSHSKLCEKIVRGRKVGCSSLVAKKHGVSVRAANKLWKPRIDRLLQQVYYTNIMILPVRSYLWSGHVYWAFCRTGLATIAKGTPGQKGQKTRCCWVVWATDWAFTVSLFVHLVWFTEAIRIHKRSFRLSLSPIVLHTAGIVNLTSSQLAACLRM